MSTYCNMTPSRRVGVSQDRREMGGMGGREVQEGRNICIPMADSF